jgi:hypothetical protein
MKHLSTFICDVCSDEIAEALTKLMLWLKRFGDYSHATNPQAFLEAEKFARNLFVWRKPVPKFRKAAISVINYITHSL